MNYQFASSLARALPSIGRQCQLRTCPVYLARSFSSSPRSYNPARDNNRDSVEELFNVPDQSPVQSPGQSPGQTTEDSPISALSKMMKGTGPSDGVSKDFSDWSQDIQGKMLDHYADRQPPYHLHIYSHRHNTMLTLTRPNGDPILVRSSGQIGFRKASRGSYEAAYQLSVHMFGQMQEKGLLLEINRLELIFRDFGVGREAFTKVLLGNEGKNVRGLVSRVTDSTRIKFGGPRSRKVRRLG